MSDCGGTHTKINARTFCLWGCPEGARFKMMAVMEVGTDGAHWELVPDSMGASDFNELYKRTQALKERKERDLGENEGAVHGS